MSLRALEMFFCYKLSLEHATQMNHLIAWKELSCGITALAFQVECWPSVLGKCLVQVTQTFVFECVLA